MARDETEGMDGIVKDEVLRLLRKQIEDPYSFLGGERGQAPARICSRWIAEIRGVLV